MRNFNVDLMRVIACMIILAYHLTLVGYLNIGQPFSLIGFFLIVTGFFTASAVVKERRNSGAPFPSITRFIYRKMMTFFPYLIASSMVIIPMVMLMNLNRFHNTLAQSIAETVLTFFGDVSLLVMTGIPRIMGNVATWYLSGMILALLITYPLLIIFKEGFTRWAAPLIGLFSIGAVVGCDNGVFDPFNTVGIFQEGLLACIGFICIGYFLYEVVQNIKSKELTRFGRNVLSAIELIGWTAVILMIVFFNGLDPFSKTYYALLEIALVVICTAITCSGLSSISLDTSHRPSLGKLSKWLATASLIMYLSNYYQFYFASRYLGTIEGWTVEQQWAFIIISFVVSCILVYAIGRLLAVIGRKLKGKMTTTPATHIERP